MSGSGGSAAAVERADERGNVRESILLAGDAPLFERNSAMRTNDNDGVVIVSFRLGSGKSSVVVAPLLGAPNVEIRIGPWKATKSEWRGSEETQISAYLFVVVRPVVSVSEWHPNSSVSFWSLDVHRWPNHCWKRVSSPSSSCIADRFHRVAVLVRASSLILPDLSFVVHHPLCCSPFLSCFVAARALPDVAADVARPSHVYVPFPAQWTPTDHRSNRERQHCFSRASSVRGSVLALRQWSTSRCVAERSLTWSKTLQYEWHLHHWHWPLGCVFLLVSRTDLSIPSRKNVLFLFVCWLAREVIDRRFVSEQMSFVLIPRCEGQRRGEDIRVI